MQEINPAEYQSLLTLVARDRKKITELERQICQFVRNKITHYIRTAAVPRAADLDDYLHACCPAEQHAPARELLAVLCAQRTRAERFLCM